MRTRLLPLLVVAASFPAAAEQSAVNLHLDLALGGRLDRAVTANGAAVKVDTTLLSVLGPVAPQVELFGHSPWTADQNRPAGGNAFGAGLGLRLRLFNDEKGFRYYPGRAFRGTLWGNAFLDAHATYSLGGVGLGFDASAGTEFSLLDGLSIGPVVKFAVSGPSQWLMGGLTFTVGVPSTVPPDADFDGDGFPNRSDPCIDEAGPPENLGCPDTDKDGDGIPDRLDKCMSVAEDLDGFEDQDGCPDYDNDGDGLEDTQDKCPNVAGPAENQGCPDVDGDGDGVVDRFDACPSDKGPAENKGCPDLDGDGDGVVDRLDNCPQVKGAADNQGCPWADTDGDGVTDHVDNCPAAPGPADNQGCPAKVKQLVVLTRERLAPQAAGLLRRRPAHAAGPLARAARPGGPGAGRPPGAGAGADRRPHRQHRARSQEPQALAGARRRGEDVPGGPGGGGGTAGRGGLRPRPPAGEQRHAEGPRGQPPRRVHPRHPLSRPCARFGTLVQPGTYTAPGELLVGRTVANAAFLEALCRHGSFEELVFLTGENGDLAALEALTTPWNAPDGRLVIQSVWQLPELLARGALDVLHHGSHVDRLHDLLAVRNRYAARATPVTGQVHSLSYPRLHQDLARWLLLPPSATDAIFCSSTAGRTVVEQGFAAAAEEAKAREYLGEPRPWALPHVPLGVDVASLQGGDRRAARAALGLPDDAVVLLSIARFTEHDKMDLFPLLQVLERLVHEPTPEAPPVYLLLAGARQGTQTPEMLTLWARALGVEARLKLAVDFPSPVKRELLACADLFVSPVDNVQETFGQSVVEALAAGLPCVVSDFDGYKDTVDATVGRRVTTRLGVDWSELSHLAPLLYERPLHLVLGQSVEVDLPALEAALRELVAQPALRAQLGEAARARARDVYDWSRVIPRYEATWRHLAAQPWERPAGAGHPLRLDYSRLFGHYGTGPIAPDTRVVRSSFSRNPGTPWLLYPELKHLLGEADVRRGLSCCEAPCTVAELRAALVAGLGERPRWVADLAVTWLLKHGLVSRVA